MVSVDNKRLVWMPVNNSSCSSFISHEITAIWYIIKLISCNRPIDYVESHTPYFDLFVWRSWSMPDELRNITMQHILSSAGDPDGIIIGKAKQYLLWLEFSRIALGILTSVLFGISLFPLSEVSSPPVVWIVVFILWHVLIDSEDLASATYLSTRMNTTFLY